MRLVRKPPAAPEPVAKADPAEAVAATLERVEEASAKAMTDAAMVNKAVVEALAKLKSDEPRPTRFEVQVTARDAQGRLKSFVIEAK